MLQEQGDPAGSYPDAEPATSGRRVVVEGERETHED